MITNKLKNNLLQATVVMVTLKFESSIVFSAKGGQIQSLFSKSECEVLAV